MFLLKLCLFFTLTLLFPPSTRQSCMEGTAKECLEADLAPGTNLAGDGFDITRMERKGAFVLDMNPWRRKDRTCVLCSNPYVENRKQKLPLAVVDWRPNQACSMKVASSLHRSSESLLSSSTHSVENNWKANLNVDAGGRSASLMLAGTKSKLAEYSMTKTKNDKFSFTSHSMSCQFYSYRVSKSARLSQGFKHALNQLPKVYSPENKQRFYKLIDDYGTHYITKVKLGGGVSSVTSIRQCQASMEGLSVQDVEMCLEVEASASVKVATLNTEVKHCRKDGSKTEDKSFFSSHFSDRFTEIKGGHTTEPDLLFSADKNPSAYKDWLATLAQNPDIVSYSLEPLHQLLRPNTPTRKNLRSAVSHYILEKGLWRNCSSGCKAGIKSDPRDSCVCQCHNDPAVTPDCCPTRKGMARVIVTVQRATGLWGDTTTSTDGFVKVFFNGAEVRRSPVIWNNNHPHWGMVVDLGSQDVSNAKLRLEVWDEDNKWDDDLLGSCEPDLSSGVKEDLCNLQRGQLYYKLDVKCAPSLGGGKCDKYEASPMTQSLQKFYMSRHAHPVPKAVLLEMGVFVDQSRNQSLTVIE